jgi:YVTN family beta-propeller protein
MVTKPVSVTWFGNVEKPKDVAVRRNGHRNRSRLLLLALCYLLFFGVGCASFKEYVEPQDVSHGQLTVFLKGHEKTSIDMTFILSAVNIVTEDGIAREIMDSPVTIKSVSITGKQILLSERYLPEGRYKGLQFIVKQATIKREDRTANMALPPEGIEVSIDISIIRNHNTTLFLTWDADASIVDGYLFSPVFSIREKIPELSSLLIYVTNEESNNVSVINRQTGDIAATIMAGKKPRGIAASSLREYPRVYAVNSGSNSISVIDSTVNEVEIEIPVRFGREPEGIAVARISSEKELIFVANYGSDNISVFDAATYQEVEKISVGSGPVAVAADPSADSLSVTRFLSFEDVNLLRSYREKFFNIYVANKNSRDVSVIKMDRISNRPDEVINLKVEWNPVAISVDYQRGKVYVANYSSDNISVIDILQIIRGNINGAVSTITNTGTSVTGVVADPDLDRLYLLKELTGEIMIVRLFAEAFTPLRTAMAMAPIIDTIPVGKSPRSLILDPEGRKIYVVNRGSNTVSVVDKTTKRQEKVIPVGKRPYGIAMFPF